MFIKESFLPTDNLLKIQPTAKSEANVGNDPRGYIDQLTWAK